MTNSKLFFFMKYTIFYILFCFIFFSCKNENSINKKDHKTVKHSETSKTDQNLNYYEVVKTNKKSDYNLENEIQKLDIEYNTLNIKIRYIEDKATLSIKNEDILMPDWQPVLINSSYDISMQDAGNDIHLLLKNNNTSKGYILLPAYTEQFLSYFVYYFQNDTLDYIGNFEHINLKKGILYFNEKTKELYILSDEKYTLKKLK